MLLKWQVDRDNLLELVQLESFSHTKNKEVNEFDSIHPPWLTMSCKPFVNFTPTPIIQLSSGIPNAACDLAVYGI